MKQTEMSNRILIASDDHTLRQALSTIVKMPDFVTATSETVDETLRTLMTTDVDLLIISEGLYRLMGVDLKRSLRRQMPATDLLLVGPSANDCEESLLHLTDRAQTIAHIRGVLEIRRLRRETANLRSHIATSYAYDNIVGTSKPITQLKETIARIAPTDISVLVSGPSGSGKELIARTVHQHSERQKAPFIALDCSAHSESIVEAELFGDSETDSRAQLTGRRSLCEQADGGTLYLNEVGNLSSTAQNRLLAFLQDGTVMTDSGQLKKVDVRVMGATSTPMAPLVASREFREDLYYKLAVIPLSVPSLAERPEDIELLTAYFLHTLSVEFGYSELFITPLAVEKLQGHRWPGNVRELENTLRRAAVLSIDGVLDISNVTFVASGSVPDQTTEGKHSLTLGSGLLADHQREIIVKALDDHKWNFTRTAAALGIGRTTLWRKVKKFNLVPAGVMPADE